MQELINRQVTGIVKIASVPVPNTPEIFDGSEYLRTELASSVWHEFVMQTGGNKPNMTQNFLEAIQVLNKDPKVAARFKVKTDSEVYFIWKRENTSLSIDYYA